jgi:xanthine dehydrogenase accessory factor
MSLYDELRRCIAAEESVALASTLRPEAHLGAKLLIYPDGRTRGTLGPGAPTAAVVEDARALLRQGVAKTRAYTHPESGETWEVFIDVYPAPETLVIVGAVHTAMALCRLAKVLGFRIIIVDPRAQFANQERFPDADRIIVAYPDDAMSDLRMDDATSVVILAHDPKLDEPAIEAALSSGARYVGAIGSRKTNVARFERLRRRGLTDAQLARLRAPIGLDLGAETPEEIALSVLAEVVAVKYGRSGGALAHGTGPVHVPR